MTLAVGSRPGSPLDAYRREIEPRSTLDIVYSGEAVTWRRGKGVGVLLKGCDLPPS
jgi:hypothetical protein